MRGAEDISQPPCAAFPSSAPRVHSSPLGYKPPVPPAPSNFPHCRAAAWSQAGNWSQARKRSPRSNSLQVPSSSSLSSAWTLEILSVLAGLNINLEVIILFLQNSSKFLIFKEKLGISSFHWIKGSYRDSAPCTAAPTKLRNFRPNNLWKRRKLL